MEGEGIYYHFLGIRLLTPETSTRVVLHLSRNPPDFDSPIGNLSSRASRASRGIEEEERVSR